MVDTRSTVAVVGAGVAGLAAAWELVHGARPDAATPRVVVLEADQRVGGRLASSLFAGRTVDVAADAFLARRPEAVTLVGELGLDDELVPAGTSGASVWARGRLRALPTSLALGVPTRWWPVARSAVLPPRALLTLAGDLFPPHRSSRPIVGDASVGDIVGRRLGRAVVETLADPLIGGIHAGSADELSAAALLPLLIAADQQPGSLMRGLRRSQPPADPHAPVFLSLRGSTASLATRLADALAARGVEFRRGTRVDALEPSMPGARGRPWSLSLHRLGASDPHGTLEADAVLLALPAPEVAVLLAPLAPEAAGTMAEVPHASVATVTVLVPSDTLAGRRGTGFLVPRSARLDGRAPLVTAATYLDRKWPHLAGDDGDLVRLSVGRHGDDRHRELDDDELVATTVTELGELLGTSSAKAKALEALVTRWPAAFPQYTVGHLLRMGRVMDEVDRVGGLAVAGAAYRGVGIPACIASGRTAARRIADHLGGRGPGGEWRAAAGSGGTRPAG